MSSNSSGGIFEDFDAEDIFPKFKRAVESAGSKNFVLDFSHEKALCAFDISLNSMKEAIRSREESSKVYVLGPRGGCCRDSTDSLQNRKKDTRWMCVSIPRLIGSRKLTISETYGFLRNRRKSSPYVISLILGVNQT